MGIALTRLGAALLAIGFLTDADDPPVLPRYRLKTGQELTYRSESQSERKGGKTDYLVDWKVWVVGQASDGSSRLVLRCDLKVSRPDQDGKKEDDQADTLVWRCRLFDDGRLVGATTRGTVRDPSHLFPQLPADPRAMALGWDSPGLGSPNTTNHFRMAEPARPGATTLAFAMSDESPENKVYVLTHSTRSTFELARGLVSRVETENTSGYGITGTTKGTIELVSVEDKGEAWAESFARESDTFFTATDAYETASMASYHDAASCQAALDKAKETLAQTAKSIREPAFVAKLDSMLAAHAGISKFAIQTAERIGSLIAKPAADWEAKDLDGKTHRMADYRGKVVVLDFWYRGCGWCITAMPQVNRLSEAFRDEPVAVLGMTIDKDEQDARVVVDAMALRYPAILAEGLPEKFSVQAYPTLIVVDRSGKVREFHVGYSPQLFEEISAIVRRLLDEKLSE